MSQIKALTLRFRQSTSADVVGNRVRIRPANTPGAYDGPFDDIVPAPAPDQDGFTRIPLANIPAAVGLEGTYDIHVTALDAANNESDFLEIDNQTFDISAPNAPTEGAVE